MVTVLLKILCEGSDVPKRLSELFSAGLISGCTYVLLSDCAILRTPKYDSPASVATIIKVTVIAETATVVF